MDENQLSETEDLQAPDNSPDEANELSSTKSHRPNADSLSEIDPSSIGRYRIIRRLGQGGFGRVYLAHDDELERPVAIKVPNPERITHPQDVEAYLNEARILARLDHPNIVPVHDVGRTEDGLCFVVSKFIEGSDLAVKIGRSRPSFRDSAELIVTIGEALHYAHTRGLVHRDVKPANILIDSTGRPCLADFGLALSDEDFGKGRGLAGTPTYMSPEQARGEGHRVDGRSDIFSLGVVYYELLTGRKPFTAETRRELLDLVTTTEARPPRQIDDTIPRELERICLKALAKKATDRYTTAKDMAEDLRYFLNQVVSSGVPVMPANSDTPPPGSTQEITPPPTTPRSSDSDQKPLKIVPKGLRSFDEHDADFFLELLPGPRDRDGLPESIRFWKRKIEQIDSDKTFKVGLIYGPSGCGKSSLIKAGLLPRLGKHVFPVYVEATAEETESRLLKGIRKVCPELPQRSNLVESLATLRRGRILPAERKVLLVLDQFEQWLHADRSDDNSELVAALRHCDGEHVQAVVLVRDDFWLAVSRFMADLEIELIQGANTCLVDLFDPRHARKLLMAFGQAYGTLPEKTNDLSKDQQNFLDQAIADLTQDGKIVSVRLALFAEMVKGKSWTPTILREIGGAEGVGVTFLEETFSSAQANPKHRLHQKPAQAVLKALLPESGTDIKGQMRSEQELREAGTYSDRPRDFAELIHILDAELRLITPTDPEGSGDERRSVSPGERYYQLTHDYLVHSLREWLTRKQRETPRGRAELRLAERSSFWNAMPENRHLPSLLEWANIRSLTKKKDWTDPQHKMMKRSGWVHGSRTLVALILAGLLAWGGIEGYGTMRASSLVESLRSANTPDVPRIVRQLDGYRRWANPRLQPLTQIPDDSSREKLHGSLALLPVDASQFSFLEKRLLVASPTELQVIRDALKPHRSILIPKLWSVLDSAKPGDAKLLPAASALAEYDADSPQWAPTASKVAQALVSVNPVFLGAWLDALRNVGGKFNAPLAAIFRDKKRPESERTVATNILTDYAKDDPGLIANLLMDADPKPYAAIFPISQRFESKTLPLFQEEIAKKATVLDDQQDSETIKDQLAERQARAAIALLRMGKASEVIPLLRHSADSRLRSFIINWLNPLGADPRVLVAQLGRINPNAKPTPSQGQQKMDAILFRPETSQRRALILALGTYGRDGLSPSEREPLISKLIDMYKDDPDSGIHGAAEWTLRKCEQQGKLKEADAQLVKKTNWGDHRWFLNSQGQTFAVIEGPVEFLMGSPTSDTERYGNEAAARRMVIPRRFAIAAMEVTVQQYHRFGQKTPAHDLGIDGHSPYDYGPQNGLDWYDCVAYCNWLSEQEGLPKDQWCYVPNKEAAYAEGMSIPADVLQRRGYRLPTEAEWEYACRAGAVTSRYYGQSIALLDAYAWNQVNSEDRAGICGSLLPNDLGLFDMLGNVYEWCKDNYNASNPGSRVRYSDAINAQEYIYEKNRRPLRGGTFNHRAANVRSAYRSGNAPAGLGTTFGFRPSRTLPPVALPLHHTP